MATSPGENFDRWSADIMRTSHLVVLDVVGSQEHSIYLSIRDFSLEVGREA